MRLIVHRCFMCALVCLALLVGAVGGRASLAEAAGRFRLVAPLELFGHMSPAFDAAGRVVISDGGSVWIEEATGLVTKLAQGSQAPGLAAGTLIGEVVLGSPVVQKGPPTIVARLQNGSHVVYVDEPGLGLRVVSSTGKAVNVADGLQVLGFSGHGTTRAPEPVANMTGEVLMKATSRLGRQAHSAWERGLKVQEDHESRITRTRRCQARPQSSASLSAGNSSSRIRVASPPSTSLPAGRGCGYSMSRDWLADA